jgi:hypothetical protein
MLKKNNANQYIIVRHSFKHDIALFNVTLGYSLPIKRAIFQQQCMQAKLEITLLHFEPIFKLRPLHLVSWDSAAQTLHRYPFIIFV